MQERIIYLKYQSKKSFFVFPRLDKELRIRYSCKDSAFSVYLPNFRLKTLTRENELLDKSKMLEGGF